MAGVDLLGSYYVPSVWDRVHSTAHNVIRHQNVLVGALGSRPPYQTGSGIGMGLSSAARSTLTLIPQESRYVQNRGQLCTNKSVPDLKLDPRLSNAVAMMSGKSPLDSTVSEDPAEVNRKRKLAVLRDHIHSGPGVTGSKKRVVKRGGTTTQATRRKALKKLPPELASEVQDFLMANEGDSKKSHVQKLRVVFKQWNKTHPGFYVDPSDFSGMFSFNDPPAYRAPFSLGGKAKRKKTATKKGGRTYTTLVNTTLDL